MVAEATSLFKYVVIAEDVLDISISLFRDFTAIILWSLNAIRNTGCACYLLLLLEVSYMHLVTRRFDDMRAFSSIIPYHKHTRNDPGRSFHNPPHQPQHLHDINDYSLRTQEAHK